MAEYWAAAIAVAGTVYSAYKQNQAIDAANAVHPKAFVPVNVGQTAQMALIADKAGYDLSDQDFQRRFPQLVAGKNYNINDVANNLSGKTSPTVTNGLNQSGLSADLGDNQFKQARNLGLPIAAIENRNRGYFQQMLGDTPQRSFGLSGQDVTRIAVANTGSQNNYNQGLFQSNIARYNTGIQQNIANNNATVAGLSGLAGLLTQNNINTSTSGYLDPAYYNKSTGGGGGGGYTGDINAAASGYG